MKITIKAYCKINIFLNVSNIINIQFKKHKLESVCIKYHDLYDVIYISKANDLNIKYFKDNNEIFFEQDLIKKALFWLKNKFHNIDINYEISVIKNIPIGSGLGGESTDIACVLNYIIKEYNLILNKKDYLDIALELGSDICFFLYDYDLAYISEYGNVIIPINDIELNYQLIINKNFNSFTKKVFETFDKLDNSFHEFLGYKQILDILKSKKYQFLFNNLSKATFLCYEELKIIYDNLILIYKKDTILLSGSGSSMVLLKKYE